MSTAYTQQPQNIVNGHHQLSHQQSASPASTAAAAPRHQHMEGRHSDYPHPHQQHSDHSSNGSYPPESSKFHPSVSAAPSSADYGGHPPPSATPVRSAGQGQYPDYLQQRPQYSDAQRGYPNTPGSTASTTSSMAHHSQSPYHEQFLPCTSTAGTSPHSPTSSTGGATHPENQPSAHVSAHASNHPYPPIDPNIAASGHPYSPQHHYSPYGPHHDMPPQYHTPAGMYRPPEYGSPYGAHPHGMPGPYGHVAPSGHPMSTVYSFVPIPGTHQQKRPRRRYEEIERMYKCGWNGCEKAYGTLNHLNAHVTMQSHGQKRTPEEFKEIRKEWKARKKEEETQRKAEEERQRQAAQQSGSVESSNSTDGAAQPPPGNYPQGVRQLPPLAYPTGGQVSAQYGQPPAPMEGMPQYANGQMPSYYQQPPYGQGQMYHPSHSATPGQQEPVSSEK